jgi:GAF domain-containing protein
MTSLVPGGPGGMGGQKSEDPIYASPTVSRRLVFSIIAAGAILQTIYWAAVGRGLVPVGLREPGLILIAWTVIFGMLAIAIRSFASLRTLLAARQAQHRATLDQMEQLEAHNEMLQALAHSTDVTVAFQVLARRVARIVPCDRVGLALLTEGGQEFQTYTARVTEPERRARPRVDLTFSLERTHIGQVVRTRQPLIVNDFAEHAAGYLDANVLHQAGFQSGMVMPLISRNAALGTLNVVSRVTNAFTDEHRAALVPIAEILAVAYVAQHLQQALARFKTTETMADLTLSIASDIQSALQTIIGHCDLLDRGYPDPALQRDVAVITRQAQRIQDLLESMRTAAEARLREVSEQVRSDPAASDVIAAETRTGSAGTPGMRAPQGKA